MRNLLLVAVACGVLSFAPARALAGNGTKALHLLGADVDAVVVIDVADARDAATFTTLLEGSGDALDDVRRGLDAVGIDLAADLDTIVMGRDDTGMVTVIEGAFTKTQLAAIRKRGEAKKHRGVTYYVDADGEIAILGKRVVLTTPGGMTGAIDRHKKKGRSLVKSPDAAAIRAAIALVDPRRDLWVAMTGDRLGGAGGLGLEAVTVAATFETQLALESRSKVVDADNKAVIVGYEGQVMPQLLQALDQLGLKDLAASVTVEWDDLVLELRATASNDELKTLLGLLNAM